MRKLVAFAFGMCVISGAVKAQTLESKFGLDSIKTLENASIYQEFAKQKNYKDAYPSWKYVYQNAPAFQKTTYVMGEDILANLFQKTQNYAYLDTLMMLYDQRMKYFPGQEGFVVGKKGSDLYRYGKKDEATLKKAYGFLIKSFELDGSKTHPVTVMIAFAVADDLMKKGVLPKEDYIKQYMVFSEYVAKTPPTAKTKELLTNTKVTLDGLFFNAGVADCKMLNDFLGKKFAADKDNLETLREVSALLKRAECTDLPLFAQVAEELYKKEPTAESAYNLAIMFMKKQEYGRTETYLKEAIDKSTDNTAKADYYLRLSQIKLANKQLIEAKKNAQEALKLNPNLGNAYIVIGKAYALYSKEYGEDEFDHQSVFWAAVDKFNKAKQVDASVADEASQLINSYSSYFPSKEEAFFRSITPGNSVSLGSWIGETTVARFR